MAADIVYHEGTHIPVGEDQKQHVEFVRDLADKTGYTKPEPVIYPNGSRIMSLTDATRKMSKSDGDNDGCIFMDDTQEEIERKVKGAKTSMNFSDDTPEANNLKEIYRCIAGKEPEFDRWPDFKKALTEVLIKELIK